MSEPILNGPLLRRELDSAIETLTDLRRAVDPLPGEEVQGAPEFLNEFGTRLGQHLAIVSRNLDTLAVILVRTDI